MLLSVVIISWNSRCFLKKCLTSLTGLLSQKDVELIWVDNGSADGAADYVKAHFPEAKTIILPKNKGVAYARNRGVEISSGRYILFLDDDTEATAEAVDNLMEYMGRHPEVGVLGCALRDSAGRLQASFKGYPGVPVKVWNVLRGKLHIKPRKVSLPQNVIYPVYVIGACQLIRREVFDKTGLLDEEIFYGPEDADFCIRTRQAGWQIAYIPHVSIRHHWRRITTRSLSSKASRAHIRALRHFWRKHRRLW
ncbi:MAG: glycosyltransferase family 2 protein [Prevotella sp.]|nr:glycosyltransferase family 2 protein [Prevotella sp.]MCM1075720.1 glycosyltransferase family 2 protein [Ruminococcus sp.]